MKGKPLPFRCVSYKESEVFINLKAERPSQLLGVAILDKAHKDSEGNLVTLSIRRGEAKVRNLSRDGVAALRQWRMVKVLDLLTKNEWILDMKTYRYAPGRLDGHERISWQLVAYPFDLTQERLEALDAQGLQGEVQIALL